MMRLLKITFLALAAASDISSAESKCLLEGSWKSNKEMTLASMNATGNVTKKQREFFEGDFFGKLLINSTCTSFTSYMDGIADTASYEILYQNSNSTKIKYNDPIEQKPVEATLTIINDCYSIPLAGLNFSEYFCRVK